MLTKRNLLVIGIIIILLVGASALVIHNIIIPSNYSKLFKNETLIIVGWNASEMELESAEVIAINLGELTRNKPVIKIDSEVSQNDKFNYNLVLVGTPYSNNLLEEVYSTTDATRVTTEYPGENKGILEILANPWNANRILILVGGSNELGVKAGSEMIVEMIKTEEKILIIGGISREEAIEIAKNDDRVERYLKNYPNHKLVKISLLKTNDKSVLYWHVNWKLAVAIDPRTIPHETHLYVSVDAITGDVLEVWVPE